MEKKLALEEKVKRLEKTVKHLESKIEELDLCFELVLKVMEHRVDTGSLDSDMHCFQN